MRLREFPDNVEIKRENIRRHLVESFENGLEDQECVGYHGTSLEAIEYMIKHGRFAGLAASDERFGYGKGDLFFYPRKSQFPDHPNREEFYSSDEDAIRDAKEYADITARAHFIVKSLGLDLGEPQHQYIGRVLGDGSSHEADDIIERLVHEKGLSKQAIFDIINTSKNRKGVVVSLNRKALERYPIGDGDDNLSGKDLRLICPKGMDYEFVSGVEPVGQEEWEFFESMQKEK